MSSTHEIPLPTEAVATPAGVRPARSAATWGSPETPSDSRSRKLRRRLIVLVLVVAAVALAYPLAGWMRSAPLKDVQLYTVVPRSFPVILEEKGELKAANSIDIRCELEGKSTIIHLIDEGSQVRKGDLLVELASDEIDEKIRDAEIKEATAQAAYEAAVKEQEILKDENASKIRKADLALQIAELALKKYTEGDAVELRLTATQDLEKGKSVLKRSHEDLKDSEELHEQGFVTRIQLENDRFKAFEADLELKKAQTALDVLDKYTVPMNLQQKESDVTEARKELDREKKSAAASEAKGDASVAAKKAELQLVKEKLEKLRDQKSKAKIFAPADGLVIYARDSHWWRSETQIQTGQSVYERQAIIELPDVSSMKVVIRVHEAQTEHLHVGLPAIVDVEGFSGRQFTGSVSKIAVLADSQNRFLNPNLKEYETEILLDGTFKELKPGITCKVQVQLAQLNNVLAVPVQSVYGKGGRYYIFADRGGTAQPVEVQVGLASSEYVEIKEGLKQGDSIRLAVSDDAKLQLPDPDKAGAGKQERPAGRQPRREREERPPR